MVILHGSAFMDVHTAEDLSTCDGQAEPVDMAVSVQVKGGETRLRHSRSLVGGAVQNSLSQELLDLHPATATPSQPRVAAPAPSGAKDRETGNCHVGLEIL